MKPEIQRWLTEQFGDDAALHQELYAQYATDMKANLAEVKAMLVNGDIEGASGIAHTMKGLSLQMGDCETANACKLLQNTGKEGDIAACVTVFPVMRDLVGAL